MSFAKSQRAKSRCTLTYERLYKGFDSPPSLHLLSAARLYIADSGMYSALYTQFSKFFTSACRKLNAKSRYMARYKHTPKPGGLSISKGSHVKIYMTSRTTLYRDARLMESTGSDSDCYRRQNNIGICKTTFSTSFSLHTTYFLSAGMRSLLPTFNGSTS